MLPVVMFFASLIVFLLSQLLSPGVRLAAYVGQNLSAIRDKAALIEKHGLNDPPWIQWKNWITNVFQGDLGFSTQHSMEVSQAFAAFFPASVELLLFAIFPIFFVGIGLGVLSATHQNSPIDHISRLTSIIGWSLPTFILGLLLLMVFYGILDWVGDGRLSSQAGLIVGSDDFVNHTGLHTIDALINGNWFVFGDAIKHLILPAITTDVVVVALIVRVMRSSMLNSLREDYIDTARAKGLRENIVIHKHARRPAMIPVLTTGGIIFAILFTGFATTEIVFNFKGLGYMFITSARSLDFATVLAFTLFTSAVFVTVNLIVDILYAVVDPRISYD